MEIRKYVVSQVSYQRIRVSFKIFFARVWLNHSYSNKIWAHDNFISGISSLWKFVLAYFTNVGISPHPYDNPSTFPVEKFLVGKFQTRKFKIGKFQIEKFQIGKFQIGKFPNINYPFIGYVVRFVTFSEKFEDIHVILFVCP